MNFIDSSIMSCFQAVSNKSEIFDNIVVSLISNSLVKGGIICAMCWWLWFRHEDPDTGVRERITLLIGSSFIALLVGRFLAVAMPYRIRPIHDPRIDFKVPYGMDTVLLSDWSAFPSDHAVFFSALAAGLLFVSKRMGILALAWVFIFCFLPRMYVGLHYPTDMIAGALIGGCYASLVMTSKTGLNLVRAPMRWLHKYPSWFYAFSFILCLEISEMFDSVRKTGILLLRALRTVFLG
ncbi:MAG: phosphatase PAP2 family protein [Desulfomonilaceae bacterium]|nr:phosphatase PAP2 family protein [Desulfomonilaceae bacterium]